MNREQVLAKLAKAGEEMRSRGVRSVSLFGSTARDQADCTSDVDLLIEFDDRPAGLFKMAQIQRRLEEILGVDHVDLITSGGLHPALREQILAEAVRAL